MLGLRNVDGKLVVCDFVEEHNHILHQQEIKYMLCSQYKFSKIHYQQIHLADNVLYNKESHLI